MNSAVNFFDYSALLGGGGWSRREATQGKSRSKFRLGVFHFFFHDNAQL